MNIKWIIVIVGIINTLLCLVTRNVVSAVISAIAIYPLCLCCKMTYGMVKAGGIPVFLLAAFFYLVISLVYASFTMKKELIQYYMLYIVLQIAVLVEAC